jgi:hypothetical protein
MGLLTFSINVTLDGCIDHQEGIAGDLRTGVQKLKDATPDGPRFALPTGVCGRSA